MYQVMADNITVASIVINQAEGAAEEIDRCLNGQSAYMC